jgi:hypothetical protein
VEPELRVTVFCFSGEADVEQLVDDQKVIKRVSVIKVELQARPFSKDDSKYILLTKREQSVVVGLFNKARSAGCGANEAIEGNQKGPSCLRSRCEGIDRALDEGGDRTALCAGFLGQERSPQAYLRLPARSDQETGTTDLFGSSYRYALAAVHSCRGAPAVVSVVQPFANARCHPAACCRSRTLTAHKDA